MVRNSIAHDVSFDNTDQGCSNGSTETFSPGHILETNVAPKQQAILHAQPVSNLDLDSFSTTIYQHPNPGTDVSISHFVSVDTNAYLHISLITPHSMRLMSWCRRPCQALPKASQTLSVTGCSLRS